MKSTTPLDKVVLLDRLGISSEILTHTIIKDIEDTDIGAEAVPHLKHAIVSLQKAAEYINDEYEKQVTQ